MGMPSAGRTGLLAACAIVVLYWTENFGRVLLDRTMVIPDRNEIFMPQGAALSLWETLMPFLFVSLIALLSLRNRRRAGAVTN